MNLTKSQLTDLVRGLTSQDESEAMFNYELLKQHHGHNLEKNDALIIEQSGVFHTNRYFKWNIQENTKFIIL